MDCDRHFRLYDFYEERDMFIDEIYHKITGGETTDYRFYTWDDNEIEYITCKGETDRKVKKYYWIISICKSVILTIK